ncbi:alpha/beta hydrolase family protein [Kordiimonas marina]|uniref:alpha/beta hydrolase family protein n=1 Tax=Kordiimonas marina TaxID=2872312 RepID=UPI001FF2C79E|nr:alpha/beta fold hydrolase [Kordiimonas marina]MCJ9429146.1 alpha/beta fold hydrolase [Kordiimonas marina]
MDWQMVEADGGIQVPVKLFGAPEGAKALLLLLPALGVQAKFYAKLAAQLAEDGIATVLMEQRGHGASPYRARRGRSFGFDDFLKVDIPAAMRWARARVPDVPFLVGGHSLGGHLSSITAGRHAGDVDGVIHLACGFPYHRLYTAPDSKRIRALCNLLPVVTLLFGHFPGKRFGFGGREFSRLMMDWRDWAAHGSYDYGDAQDVEADISAFKGPVLSLSFEADALASDQAVEYAYTRFDPAVVSHKKLGAKEQGEHLGHFDWARAPHGVAAEIGAWLDTHVTPA